MAFERLCGDRDQVFLLPPSMREWLPEGHLVWFVIDMVAELDTTAFDPEVKDPRGRRRYDPALLVTVLVYAYCVGERSSRQIERRCHEDVAFRVAAAGLAPDHTTLSRFLKDHSDAFEGLFTQVLVVAKRVGMGQIGTVFLDGTKIAADASPLATASRERIEAEVKRITDEARQVDDTEDELFGEDRRGDEPPADLSDAVTRRARLHEALEQLKAEEEADAKRPPARRRPPGKPHKVNVTDPQCRVMRGPHGYFPAFNAQAVATADGVIVAADVTAEQADNHQWSPMVHQTRSNLTAAGLDEPEVVCADNGYWTNTNATPAPDGGPEPVIAPPTDKRRKPIALRGPVPATATAAQRMERTLATQRGRTIYNKRAGTIEPIFGQIKTGRGINRFRRRGLAAAVNEWRLTATTHNILKIWRHTHATT